MKPAQELVQLRDARRRQEVVIATLSEAVSNFHRGLRAMRAENLELRAESDGLRERLQTRSQAGSRSGDEVVELPVVAGPRAPGGGAGAMQVGFAGRES